MEHAHFIPTELEARVAAFEDVLSRVAGKKVLLYGTGVNAQRLVASYAGRCAFVAAVGEGKGDIGGIPMVPWSRAFDYEPDLVVIAAKMRSTEEVYLRILGECDQRDIPVLDMYGNDLKALHLKALSRLHTPVFELVSLLETYDVLLFDAVLVTERFELMRTLVTHTPNPVYTAYKALYEEMTGRVGTIVLYSAGYGPEIQDALSVGTPGDLMQDAAADLKKENGFFRLLKQHYPGSRIANVGCSIFEDVVCPLVHGIEGYLVTAPGTERCEEPPRRSSEGVANVLKAALSLCDGSQTSFYAFGYKALGPTIAGHALWVAQHCRDNRYDRLLFASRDAYTSMKAYEVLARNETLDLPPATYFYTSRKAAMDATLDDLQVRGIARYSGVGEDHIANVSQDAKRARSRYQAYFDALGLEEGKTYGFVDFMATGTCQKLLETFVRFDLEGLYVGRNSGVADEPGDSIASWIGSGDSAIQPYLMVVETLLSSSEAPVVGFREDGTPVFGPDRRTEQDLRIADDVQRGVLTFCEEFFGMLDFAQDIPSMAPSHAQEAFAANDVLTPSVFTENSLLDEPQPRVFVPLDVQIVDCVGKRWGTRSKESGEMQDDS